MDPQILALLHDCITRWKGVVQGLKATDASLGAVNLEAHWKGDAARQASVRIKQSQQVLGQCVQSAWGCLRCLEQAEVEIRLLLAKAVIATG